MPLRRVFVLGLVSLFLSFGRPAFAVRLIPWGVGERSGAPDVFVDLHGFAEMSYTKLPTEDDPLGRGTFDVPAFYLLPSAVLNDKFAANA